jgi:hypothetical protein
MINNILSFKCDLYYDFDYGYHDRIICRRNSALAVSNGPVV